MKRFAFLFVALLVTSTIAETLRNRDKITSLPFVDQSILGNQWSGYYNVRPEIGRHLHYWFIEAEKPTEHLVLWLNGGPGCSSLDGLLYEHGPWNWSVEDDDNLTLARSPTSWNRLAHMLYLESPTGVGFSYSDSPSDYLNASDTRTADDAFRFLVQWFQDFPQYKNSKFYISGESYAGIYVPTLADRILTGNARGESNIGLVGIAVGNGVTDPVSDSLKNNLLPFMYGHALYSTQTQNEIDEHCKTPNSLPCLAIIGEVTRIFDDDILNIYDIYADCYHQRPNMKVINGKHVLVQPKMQIPCVNTRKADIWLNRADVKLALHVRSDIHWEVCSEKVNENYVHDLRSMLPIYTKLLSNNIRVLIYSGDTDASVPFTGTQYWTARLQTQPALSLWKPWMAGGQLGGFETIYPNDFRFVTIRGGGHMTPQIKPIASFKMLEHWLRKLDLSPYAKRNQ